MGALSFGLGKPPGPFRGYNKLIQLDALLELAERVMNDEPAAAADPDRAQVERLLRLGTSVGGARPKNVVEDGEGLWIAKFPDRGDRWSNARVEHSMSRLARECGITSAESRVVPVGAGYAVLVKRFDRQRIKGGYLRHRMVSGLTVLGAEDTAQSRDSWSTSCWRTSCAGAAPPMWWSCTGGWCLTRSSRTPTTIRAITR